MNVNSALNFYRSSLANDGEAFYLTSRIYLTGSISDVDIAHEYGDKSKSTKRMLRSLYQSGLVIMAAPGDYSLSAVAEAALSALDVDAAVRPHLLLALVGEDRAPMYESLAEAVLESRPELSPKVTRSLRNAQRFSTSLGGTLKDVDLAADAIVGSDSTARMILEAKTFRSADLTPSSMFIRACVRSYDDMSRWLYNNDVAAPSASNGSDAFAARTAFRAYDYLWGRKGDFVLEDVCRAETDFASKARERLISSLSIYAESLAKTVADRTAKVIADARARQVEATKEHTSALLAKLLEAAVSRNTRIESQLEFDALAGASSLGAVGEAPGGDLTIASLLGAVRGLVSGCPATLSVQEADSLREVSLTLLQLANSRELRPLDTSHPARS